MNDLSSGRLRTTSKEVLVLAEDWASAQRALVMHEQASRSRKLFVKLWGIVLAVGGMLFIVAKPLDLLEVMSRDILRLSVLLVFIAGTILLAALVQQYLLERERTADILKRSNLEAELKGMQSDKVQ